MGPVITLSTDFGLTDAHVAIMKAIILRLNPEAGIADIGHGITPQDIRQAAFILNILCHYFPSQTACAITNITAEMLPIAGESVNIITVPLISRKPG
jgi:S-adenosylmethionine hydrolase